MINLKRSILSLIIFFVFTLLYSCQKKDPDPVTKEVIEGELQYLQINVQSGTVDFVGFDVKDDKDGMIYGVGMDEANNPFLDFNATAYIDSTNLILPNTKIVREQTVLSPGFYDVLPIQFTSNKICIDYAADKSEDAIYKTTRIVGRITANTILTVGDTQTNYKFYVADDGIQKYLRPNLLSCLNKGLASDINFNQAGNQPGRFFVYDIRLKN